jgi:hypothetical protein
MWLLQIIFLLYSTFQLSIYCHNICVSSCFENINFCVVSFLCFLYTEILLECKWSNIILCLQVDMDTAHSDSDEVDAVSFGDEVDAIVLPLWVNYLKCLFPLYSGRLGAHYIWDVSQFFHVVQLICLATGSYEPFFIWIRYFTNLLFLICRPSLI